MNNNSKDPLFKEYLKVLARRDELWEIRYNSNWVELEKPYRDGYLMSYDLREDIKRREDVWIYYECLNLINSNVWCRDKKFLRKLSKGKYENITPRKNFLSEKKYYELHDKVKKFFYKHINKYGHVEYHCTLSFELTFKIKPRMIYKYQIIDSIIEQEFAEIDRKFEYKFYHLHYGYNRGVSSYARIRNKKDRAYNRSTLNKNLRFEDYSKYEYRYNHKHSALWDAWL